MTNEKFKEILNSCKEQNTDFVWHANWDWSETDDCNSVDIKVGITKRVLMDKQEISIYISGISQTQDSLECVQSAILAMNNELLSKLSKD